MYGCMFVRWMNDERGGRGGRGTGGVGWGLEGGIKEERSLSGISSGKRN